MSRFERERSTEVRSGPDTSARAGGVAAVVAAMLLFLWTTAHAEPIEVATRTIERFDGEQATGRLAFLGGLVLRGPRGFGGFSGLLVDGQDLLAVSDTGEWLRGELVFEGGLGEGRLVGLQKAQTYRRRDHLGREITDKTQGDAEALAVQGENVVVFVETLPELLAYPANGLDVDWSATPKRQALALQFRRAIRPRATEALAALPSGSLLAIAERANGDDVASAAATSDGAVFAIARDGPWAITGADALPGGDLMIVERRFEGIFEVGMRIRRLGSEALAAAIADGGGTVDGPVLLEADLSAEIDNMEAIAAEVVRGKIVLTLMSDDNHSLLQRTLLLRFVVSDPLPRAKPEPSG